MKLTKVTATALQGASFTLDLGAITYLIGKNATGKSTRRNAIRLLLLGHLPELGIRKTYKLCSGREMVVEGWFDNGTYLKRRWYFKGDTFKTEVILPPGMEDGDEVLAAMLDANTYFGLSSRDQVAYIFKNVPMPADVTVPGIIQAIADGLQADEKIDHKSAAKFMTGLGQADADTLREMEEKEEGPWTPQSYLDFALEHAVGEAKKSKDHADMMQKTVQGIIGIRSNDEKPVDLAALDARKAEIEHQIQELRTQKETHFAAAEIVRSNNRRREELLRRPSDRPGLEIQKASKEAAIRAMVTAIAEIPAVSAEELSSLQDDRRSADSSVASHAADLRNVEESLTRNRQELDGINSKEACPYCGAKGDGWKAIKQTEVESAIAGLTSKKATLEEHLLSVRTHAFNLTAKIGTISGHQNQRIGKEKELQKLKDELAAIERQLAAAVSKEEEIARIPAPDNAPVVAEETARTAINIATRELTDLDEQRKTAMRRAGDLQRLAEAETGRDASKLDEAAAKRAAEIIRDRKAKMVAQAFGPLLESANGFFGSLLRSPIAYNEADTEIGIWRDGGWVSHAVLSGYEQMVVYAAIQAALAAKAPCRIMILDEMHRAQGKIFSALCELSKDAVRDGRLDCFVGIIPGDVEAYQHLLAPDVRIIPVEDSSLTIPAIS